MKTYFNTADAQSAKLAEFYLTKDGRRFTMLNATKFEAMANISTADVKRLGCMITGKKPNGLEVKLTCTVYKCSSLFDDIVEEYKLTGVLPTFEVQVTSEDKASTVGRDTKVYKDCVLDGDVLLNMFDAGGEFIEQEITAYAMDYESAEKYTEPDYMM